MSPIISTLSTSHPNQPATCQWTIEYFTSAHADYIQPGTFCPPHNRRIHFDLLVLPRLQLTLGPNEPLQHMSVFLRLTECDRAELFVWYRISIVDSTGAKCHTEECETKFVCGKTMIHSQLSLLHHYLMDPINGLIVDGRLTIYCEVYVLDEGNISLEKGQLRSISKVLHDFESLLADGKHTDLTLRVGGKCLQVHKNIVTARSAVFAAMFAHDTKESQESRVDISDMSLEVCQQMLHYIYTGKVQQASLELLEAADKYQLDCLKSLCEKSLCSTLTLDSVIRTLITADMHQADQLKGKCIQYITNKVDNVKCLADWKMLSSKCDLLVELFLYSTSMIPKL